MGARPSTAGHRQILHPRHRDRVILSLNSEDSLVHVREFDSANLAIRLIASVSIVLVRGILNRLFLAE